MMDDKNMAKPALLTLLGVIVLIVAAGGSFFFGLAIYIWQGNDLSFSGLWGAFAWAMGMLGTGLLLLSLTLSGISLRFMAWANAPMASLALSCLSAAFILTCYWLFLYGLESADDPIGNMILRGIGVFCFLIVSLPPFLHWLWARSLSR